jgi:hypothetical protein
MADKIVKLRDKIAAEEKALEEFVDKANQEIAARNGRLAALRDAFALLEEPEESE